MAFILPSWIALLMLVSCAPSKQMTMEEAKHVTLSMSNKTFTPPPRNIKDILAILEETSQKESEDMKEAKRIADSPLPQNAGDKELLDLYVARSSARFRLGLFRQALDEGKEMVNLAEKLNISVPDAYRIAAGCAMVEGDFRQAIEFYERALAKFPKSTANRKHLVELYATVGNLKMAKKCLDEGTRVCARLSTQANQWALYHKANAESMRATFAEAEGRFAAAEPLRRRAIMYYGQFVSTYADLGATVSNLLIAERGLLVSNLGQQGRILQAEIESRTLLKESLEQYGQASSTTHLILSGLGMILLMQGRTQEAEELVRLALRNMNELGIPADSRHFRLARIRLGDILTGKGNYEEAMAEYGAAMKDLAFKNDNFILALVQTGRLGEAFDNISKAYRRHSKFYGEQHYLTTEVKGLRGLLNYRMKKYEDALADFSSALPVLTASTSQAESDYLKRQRLIAILEEPGGKSCERRKRDPCARYSCLWRGKAGQ